MTMYKFMCESHLFKNSFIHQWWC